MKQMDANEGKKTQKHHKAGKPASFGGLSPSEAGKKGGKASGMTRRKRKDFDWLRQQADEMLPELVQAARKEGKWKDLPSHQALMAMKWVFEYAYGRPTTKKDGGEAADESDSGFSFGVVGGDGGETPDKA